MRRFHWSDNERKWIRHILKRHETVVNGNYEISMYRKIMYRGPNAHSIHSLWRKRSYILINKLLYYV